MQTRTHARPSRAILACACASLAVAAAPAQGLLEPAVESAAAQAAKAGVRELLSEPLVASTGASTWIRGRGWKAGVSADGFEFYPAVGEAESAAILMRLDAVTLGGEPVALGAREGSDEAGRAPDRDSARRVSFAHAASIEAELREAYDFDLDSIEQTFTFQDLPRRGELRLGLEVDTNLAVTAQPDGALRFTRGDLAVTYSRAFAVDATGVKQPIETRWDGSHIELVVDESIVAGATMPLTIDPVLTVTAPDFGFGNDGAPEAVWNRNLGGYVVVFEDRLSATDHDIYAFATTGSGSVISGSLQLLAGGTVDHRRPRLAVHQSNSRMLAVALGRTQPGQNRRVYSIPFRTTSVGSSFFSVGPINQPNELPGFRDCAAADVGGRSTTDAENAFLVVWQCGSFAGEGDIRGRLIRDDGVTGSATLNIAMDANNAILPRVSASTGDPAFPDGTFNVVWIEDNDMDGRGRVRMRRVNPATENIGPNLLIHSGQDAVEAVVTSNLSKELPLRQIRPCVVGYVRQSGSGSSQTSSTSAKLVTLTDQVGLERVVSDMEDVAPDLLQADIDIATDGDGFMMTYTERTSVSNARVFMCSGGIMDRTGTAFSVTLSERHQVLENTTEDHRTPALCTQFDGGVYSGPLNDDGACVWQVYDGFTEFNLRFASLDLQNNLPDFGDRPVGAQFCAAERNAGGQTGWIHAEAPSQSATQPLRLVAEDLQLFATGYLIVADTAGFVTNPGGSAGNLCVIGAGRYVNDVASAGTTGQIQTTVDPTSLPQPTGPVTALPGDTWYFQYWYRDIQSGLPTSNFTNAAAIYFTP